MKIHTDHNGITVNAISERNSVDVDGHIYEVHVDGHVYEVQIGQKTVTVEFQFGPVKEVGVNGLTNEALLAILAHRIGVLNEKFPCRENSMAITKIEEAKLWLDKRTNDRLTRGVEGKNEV